MPLLMPPDPVAFAEDIRREFSKYGGRVQTQILSLPDGTVHVEPGMSIKVDLAARFMAAFANNSIYGRHQPAQLATMAVECVKALLRAVKEDAESEVVKDKVLAETKGDDAP